MRSHPRILFALSATILFFLLGNTQLAAQFQDSQTYRVRVNDAISISSPGNALISHNLTNSDQVFPEQVWTAYTTNASGATVDFSLSRFIHQNFFFFRRNARIDLRIVSSDSTADWQTTVSSDRTSSLFFSGPTANVQAVSTGSGAGELGVIVSFIEFNSNFLAAGRYNARLTGRITNN